MKKSKYALNVQDVYKMNEIELKKYIRNASKSLSKKIKSLQKIPYGGWSQTLEYIEQSSSLWSSGKSMFATQGLTTTQLRDKAFFVNVLANIDEQVATFESEMDEQIASLIDNADTPEKKAEVKEYFSSPENFESLRYFAKKHWDRTMQYIGSKEVNRLANEYGEDSMEFYWEYTVRTLHEIGKSRKNRFNFFKKKRR